MAEQGNPSGKLHGVPFLTKELIDIEGLPTRFGSAVYATGPAHTAAPALRRLQEAGAHLLGTTHMVEYAFGSWGTNYLRGTPWNPSDTEVHRAPGGSSSGSTVAVAAGVFRLPSAAIPEAQSAFPPASAASSGSSPASD